MQTAAKISTPRDQQSDAVRNLIDSERYPIHDPESRKYQEAVAHARRGLEEVGCAVIPQFLRPDTLAQVTRESEALGPKAHFNDTYTNPYNSADDPSLPEDHPKRMFQDRSNGFVAGDLIGQDTCVRRLYHAQELQNFLADCLGVSEIHEYADPLAGLVINVLRPGCQHPWHFDTNEFIVTMMTKEPEQGGVFEYCPGIRSTEDECFDDVRDTLKGDRRLVKELELRPGDMQIFFGRYSLHRVTRVHGEAERHTLILGYSKEPNQIGRAERSKRIFGRIADVHKTESEREPARSDKLAD